MLILIIISLAAIGGYCIGFAAGYTFGRHHMSPEPRERLGFPARKR